MSDAPDEDATADESAAPPEPELLHGVPVGWSLGQQELFVPRDELVRVVRALHDDGYLMCVDLCAVDYLTYGRRTAAEGDVVLTTRVLPGDTQPERFEVVYLFLSHRDRSRVRVRVQVPEDDPVVPSLFDVHPGTEAMEREAFDMYGIAFDGHPDPSRILMPEDWIGHPLRKDYSSGRIPVQFKAAPANR